VEGLFCRYVRVVRRFLAAGAWMHCRRRPLSVLHESLPVSSIAPGSP